MLAALIDSVRRRCLRRDAPAAQPAFYNLEIIALTQRAVTRRGRSIVSREEVCVDGRYYYEMRDDRGDIYRIPRG